jgi:branched-chain amino acid transport system substrate-binding protein
MPGYAIIGGERMKSRMAKRKQLVVGILAIALAALLLLTACAPAPIVGEKPAQFGWILPLTGGGASAMGAAMSGAQDYLRYLNEQEAIPGLYIECLWRDTALQVALGIGHYERFIAAGMPLIAVADPALVAALKGRYERDEVVGFITGVPGHGDMYPDPGWYYTSAPITSERAAAGLQYFMENWKEERSPRLAFMHVDHATGYAVRYATGYARSLGFEVLPPEVVPLVPLDTTVQLLRLREDGADLVYILHSAEATGTILRDAERLGLLGEFQFMGDAMTMGDRAIKLAGAATEGYLVTRPVPWFDETDVPGIKLIIDNMMKYHGEVRRDGEYFAGWVGVAVICEAMRRVIEDLGYENLDGPATKEALDGMKDFDVYGVATITYRPGDHRGSTKMAVYEVRGGEQVRLSDWREAPSGRDWEYE